MLYKSLSLRPYSSTLFLSIAIVGCVAAAVAAPKDPLKLVSAGDHIEGSFTTSESVYATQTNIYLVSAQGTLFVLNRSKPENFPLVESINLGEPLTGVR